MKKILIVHIHAYTGGIEKALLNLLKELSKDKNIKTDLLLFNKRGDLLKEYSKYCNILPEKRILKMIGMNKYEAVNSGFFYFLGRNVLGFISKYISSGLVYRLVASLAGEYSGYDAAIAYVSNVYKGLYGGACELVAYRTTDALKASFIHCDFEEAGQNTKYNKKLYKAFDKILTVSDSCREKIVSKWPQYSNKIKSIYNICDTDEIKSLSKKSNIRFKNNKINFLSILRIDKVKGIDRTIQVLKKLKDSGFDNFIWFIIGDGPDKKNYEKKVFEYNMNKNIIFLGKKNNPYPYLKSCDCLLVLSLHEAAPVVWQEAAVLGVPVIATRTCSADELIADKECGIVCKNSASGIYKVLYKVLNDKSILNNINCKRNLKEENALSMNCFYNEILKADIKSDS